ncbi:MULTISPECIES: ABC transporter permease [Plantibacter]|jgi:peptide/nickel transport system permease protein|uniref:Oligopeptide transport system permease protein OppC n=2 Tax=Plantibacter TaxID=190323 RepID=A0ABY1LKF3_9MICO|nr:MULTISPECIES: ABC transporter permease [Plantibacter]MBD8537081.1 ABC transporter permease [Plantibacter sp. CFBP 13570]MBF4565489.1 ABC transporter permease [Plantibacter sp. VKM Ac-2876]MDD9152517.1 ABC transporter permease [Plantibacter flavus]SKC53128.1 peptide/nickel transport system permease protein [Plantibacter cousiniae]SMQ67617.1 peptide/nickel transport system permease protein [Plantibacter sp. VKM Ac-1784]
MALTDPSTLTVGEPETMRDAPKRPQSRGRTILRKVLATKRARIGGGVLLFIILWAFIGPLLSPWSFTDQDGLAFSQPPSLSHWFGTNNIGQDVYAQTLVGLQKSIVIGLIVGPGAAIIAGLVGAIAGYVGGVWDKAIVWLIDLLLVIPGFFLLVLLSPAFKSLSWLALVVFLVLFGWMVLARVIRGQTMSLREREYVKAARFMGVPGFTIIRRHIIPNVASLLIIDATLGIGAAILSETTLSFFGFGVQAPDVSLGTLLAAGASAAVTRPWLFVFPAAILVITVLASSLLGDALRDAIDPTSGANRD